MFQVINRRILIIVVLREAVTGAIDVNLYNKLMDAATQFEDVVFHKAITKVTQLINVNIKEEYARYISEKTIQIRNNGRKEFKNA